MTSQINETSIAKTLLHKVIEAQPDDASYEEIMREMAFERMLERGLADVRAGRLVSHQEALQRIRSWRN
jgi:predicted transcriptional regulator